MRDFPVPVVLYGALLATEPAPANGVPLPVLGDTPLAVTIAIFLAALAYVVKLVFELAHKISSGRDGTNERTTDHKILDLMKTQGRILEAMADRVRDLHDWHNKEDATEPGVKIWYVSGWMRRMLTDIKYSVDKLVKATGTVAVRPVDIDEK